MGETSSANKYMHSRGKQFFVFLGQDKSLMFPAPTQISHLFTYICVYDRCEIIETKVELCSDQSFKFNAVERQSAYFCLPLSLLPFRYVYKIINSLLSFFQGIIIIHLSIDFIFFFHIRIRHICVTVLFGFPNIKNMISFIPWYLPGPVRNNSHMKIVH